MLRKLPASLRWLLAAVVAGIALAGGLTLAADYAGFPMVRVLVDGHPLVSDVPAVIVGGRTLLPLRAVATALGAQVDYNAATHTVTITSSGDAAALSRQLAEARARLSDLEATARAVEEQAGGLQSSLDQIEKDTGTARDGTAALQDQATALQAGLKATQEAVTRAQAALAQSAGQSRRDALKSAVLADVAGGPALQGITPRIGSLDSRFIWFVRTWELSSPANETVVLKDPRGRLLDSRTRSLPGSGRYSDLLALDLAVPGTYTLEVTLGGQPAATFLLPVADSSGSLFTAHARIIPGDSAVTPAMLQAAADTFERISNPIDTADFGVSLVRVQNVKIYSSADGYTAGLIADGESPDSAANLVQNATGLSSRRWISIPYYLQANSTELRDTLTHELFHAMVNRLGLDERLPSWANEGIAWREGLKARARDNPAVYLDGYLGRIKADVAGAAQRGTLLPLYSSNADLIAHLNADYNLEWQDYMAVDYLSSLVPDGIGRYLQKLQTESADAALQEVFGLTQQQLDLQLRQRLLAIAARPDHGVRLTLQLPDDPGATVYVLPKNSDNGVSLPVSSGTVNVTVSGAGSISSDRGTGAGASFTATSGSTVQVGVIPARTILRGGRTVRSAWFTIRYRGGVYYYSHATYYYTDGSSEDADTAAELLGVKLLAVQQL